MNPDGHVIPALSGCSADIWCAGRVPAISAGIGAIDVHQAAGPVVVDGGVDRGGRGGGDGERNPSHVSDGKPAADALPGLAAVGGVVDAIVESTEGRAE